MLLGAYQPPLLLAAQLEGVNVAWEVVSLVMVLVFGCSYLLLISTSLESPSHVHLEEL